MKENKPSLIKLAAYTYRYTQSYTDEALEKFQLSSGTYPFLLELNRNEGISQNQISKDINVDKAMSARAIKRLIELGYIRKEEDEKDARAFKLYLTEKAKAVLPEIVKELKKWADIITEDLTEQEKTLVVDLMEKVMHSAKKHKNSKL